MRRIGIVALARKLLVVLWRYLDRGEVPEGGGAGGLSARVGQDSIKITATGDRQSERAANTAAAVKRMQELVEGARVHPGSESSAPSFVEGAPSHRSSAKRMQIQVSGLGPGTDRRWSPPCCCCCIKVQECCGTPSFCPTATVRPEAGPNRQGSPPGSVSSIVPTAPASTCFPGERQAAQSIRRGIVSGATRTVSIAGTSPDLPRCRAASISTRRLHPPHYVSEF